MNLKKWISASAIAAGAFLFQPSASADTFSGVWKIQMTPTSSAVSDGAKAFDESLIFEDEEVLSENFSHYGFQAGNRGTNDENSTFCSAMTSRTKGNLNWHGTVTGGNMRGTLTWTKGDGTVWVFAFCGVCEN